MNCPYCNHTKSKVVDKRDNTDEGTTRRRRECMKCDKRYTTYERVENIDLTVVKKDGNVEQFNREKLAKSIRKAAKPSEISDEMLKKMVDDMESRLLSRKSPHVTYTDIGRMVLTRLKRYSPVAYMRFASIYKGFENLDDFNKELRELKKDLG